MEPGPDARCAVLTRAAREPLAGTAPTSARWVCVEHQGAWPRDITAHTDAALGTFALGAAAAGWRLLLIRRPGRRSAGSATRVFLADTAPGTARVTTFTVGGPSELAEVPLPAAGAPLPGSPVDDPLLLVCTHGRRDRCCALDGRALVQAVVEAGEPDVWESSHLGGHRFAPTALVLPTGYLYGRLDAATAVSARKAAGLGEVETALCRGRSTWSPAGQVAELAVRAATGLRDADALAVVEVVPPRLCTPVRSAVDPIRDAYRCAEPEGATTVQVTHRDGRRWAVDVAAVDGPGRPVSCGVDLGPSQALRATRVRAASSVS